MLLTEKRSKSRWRQSKKQRTVMTKKFKKGSVKKRASLMTGKTGIRRAKVIPRGFD